MRRPFSHKEDETQPHRSNWSLLGFLIGNRRGHVIGLATTSVLSGLTEAGVLAVVAQVAASLVNGSTEVAVSAGPLSTNVGVGTLVAVALGLCVARLLLQVPISYLPARIASDVQARLRNELFDAFTRASWSVQSRDLEGHLQEIMTSQVIQAGQGALQATIMVTALFSFMVLVFSALTLNLVAAVVVLAAAFGLFGVLRPLNTLGSRRARSLSQSQMNYASGIGEAIRLAEETQVFGVAEAQRERIGALTGTAQNNFFHTQLLGRLVPNMYQSLIYLVIVMGLGALYLADSGNVASLGAVVLLLVRAGSYGQQVQGSYQTVRQALPFVERIRGAVELYSDNPMVSGEGALSKVESLAFDQVSYSYRSGRPVLSEVSFELGGGEAIGVVGPSGAGKSTLVQILLQLRRPSEGRYLVNGLDVEGLSYADWQKLVAYVPQDPNLIHASVAENIRYFRDLDDEAIERAAKVARIHDDVVSWSHGYETVVGPRADAVSGGQQQRICLARALAAEPEVLVLDEPTSALDPRSETLIQHSLSTLQGNVTLVIVAHRMSTLNMCDRVMVVVDGKLEAFDTIANLQRTNPYYRSASSLAVAGSTEKQL